MKSYIGFIPPCGIHCGGCPKYKTGKANSCEGAETGCKSRKCKSIFICCVEKKSLSYCFECKGFPCSRFKKFSISWKQYNQDLIENQRILKENGEKYFLNCYNDKANND